MYHLAADQLMDRLRPRVAGMVVLDPGDVATAALATLDEDDDSALIDAMVRVLRPLAAKAHRVLRPGGATIFMGDAQSLAAWEIAAARAGLSHMAELTVLWDRATFRASNFESRTMGVRWHIRPGFRYSFNVGGGGKLLDVASRSIPSNVIIAGKVPIKERRNVAQRPVELTNLLVSLLTAADDLIVDPMCGAGSTLVSAAMCDRRWVGSDIDMMQCEIAALRAQRWELEMAELNPLYLWLDGELREVEG